MKSLLLLLVAVCAAHSSASAQTLRWTLDAGLPPSYVGGSVVVPHQIYSNAFGSLGAVLRYTHQVFSDVDVPGYFVLWVSQRGKLLKNIEIAEEPHSLQVNVVHVSDTMLLVTVTTPTSSVLRKYQVRGNAIVESVTPLNVGDSVLFGDSSVNRDTTGFFVFSKDANGSLTGIKRYTLR